MSRHGLTLLLTGVFVLTGCQPQTPPPNAAGRETVQLVRPLKLRAVEVLRESLRHENPYIRNNAIEAAVDTGQKEMMGDILRLMDDAAVAVRFAAVTAAGDMRCFGCEQEVRRRLTDEDENVRLAAAYSLVRLGHSEFYERLGENVWHKDQTVRANAVLLLGKTQNPAAIDLLHRVMRDESAEDKVRLQAIESLAQLKDNRLYRSKLWALLISKYADDRVIGIRGMGALGTQDARNAIVTMLGDDVLEVRLCAAEQLGRLGDRSGREEVGTFLARNPNLHQPDVATLLAVMAIGRIGTPDLAEYLSRALESRSEIIRLAAAQSVLLITK